MKKRDNNRLRIAIQKEGRLSEWSMDLLRNMGLQFDTYKRSLISCCTNYEMDILFLRDDDIPEYVQDGVVDLGIVGDNMVQECNAVVNRLRPLGFGFCELKIAAPESGAIRGVKDLDGLRIATTYPQMLSRFLEKAGVKAAIVPIMGSVEVTPSLDVADAVCDLVSTGSTLQTHNLVPIATVMSSEAYLVGNPACCDDGPVTVKIAQLLARLDGVLHARAAKYVMLNAPKVMTAQIQEIIAGRKSPTIVPLADPNMIAVHAVVEEGMFWEKMEQLKALGASDILVMNIEKMIA